MNPVSPGKNADMLHFCVNSFVTVVFCYAEVEKEKTDCHKYMAEIEIVKPFTKTDFEYVKEHRDNQHANSSQNV